MHRNSSAPLAIWTAMVDGKKEMYVFVKHGITWYHPRPVTEYIQVSSVAVVGRKEETMIRVRRMHDAIFRSECMHGFGTNFRNGQPPWSGFRVEV